jgi:hypothetical protein
MDRHEFSTGAIRPFEVFQEAWDLIKDEYWLIFAITIVGMLIAGASMYILIGPMFCGIYLALLRKVDGNRADFNDLWKGFEFFGASIPVVLAVVVPMIIWMCVLFFTIYVPIIAAAMAGRGGEGIVIGSFFAVIVLDIVVAVLMTVVHSLLIFAFPLIVDRRLSGVEAIRVSAKAAMKNLGGIAGMIGVSFLCVLVGYLAFCVGVYFVMPLLMAAYTVAYRRVFPKLEDRQFEPPPISAYGGG